MKNIGHQAQVTHLIIATSSIMDKFVPSLHATFGRNRRHSFDIILEITKQVYCMVQKEQFNVCFMTQAHDMKRH